MSSFAPQHSAAEARLAARCVRGGQPGAVLCLFQLLPPSPPGPSSLRTGEPSCTLVAPPQHPAHVPTSSLGQRDAGIHIHIYTCPPLRRPSAPRGAAAWRASAGSRLSRWRCRHADVSPSRVRTHRWRAAPSAVQFNSPACAPPTVGNIPEYSLRPGP
eukprot:scaffold6345_cov376-Prasinococcus_capsulatus_cf.AAC.4